MASPEPPPLPEPQDLLLLTTARITRLQDQVLASLDVSLTNRQYRVLTRIEQGFTSPTKLARLARRSLPTLSETIEGLVKRGLVDRTPSAEDRRAVVLALTSKGRKALRDAELQMTTLANDLTSALTAEEADDLASHLKVLFMTAESRLESLAS